MDNKQRKTPPAWLVLTVIALAAGLLLGLTNEVTKSRIAEQQLLAAEENRKALMPDADEFTELEANEQDGISACFEAKQAGAPLGHVVSVITAGFGGDIEVTVGIASDGSLTGIRVGGESFSETAGLGAKTREESFTGQFSGKTPPLTLKKDVDSVTGASVSSGAVTNAVNLAAEYVGGLK